MKRSLGTLAVFLCFTLGFLTTHAAESNAKETIRDIGSRREVFVDDWLIERMQGVRLVLHPPVAREVAIRFNSPWEGIDTAYVTVMKDGPRYRMYYRGNPAKLPEVTCYAESKDGITWA